ncbi:hypothetical protein SEVIR_1G220250v4 [Setaria viridis]
MRDHLASCALVLHEPTNLCRHFYGDGQAMDAAAGHLQNCCCRNSSSSSTVSCPTTFTVTSDTHVLSDDTLRVSHSLGVDALVGLSTAMAAALARRRSSSATASAHRPAMYSFTAPTPPATTSGGGTASGFWSRRRRSSLPSRPKQSGSARIWLLLRSSSRRPARSPNDGGRSRMSLKLLLRSSDSSAESRPMAAGRPRSSLKCASRRRSDRISQTEDGSDRSLLRCTRSARRCTSSCPMPVGRYASAL